MRSCLERVIVLCISSKCISSIELNASHIKRWLPTRKQETERDKKIYYNLLSLSHFMFMQTRLEQNKPFLLSYLSCLLVINDEKQLTKSSLLFNYPFGLFSSQLKIIYPPSDRPHYRRSKHVSSNT